MALDGGSANFPTGTGAKSMDLGVTGSTWVKFRIQASGYTPYEGFAYAGGTYEYNYSDTTSVLDTTKAIKVRNSAGTVVIEGTVTSFTGTNVNLNLTSNVASPPTMLMEWGN